MKINTYQKIAIITYLSVLIMWFYIQLTNTVAQNINYIFSFIFGLIPFIGGMLGMYIARGWGGLKSVVGRAIFFFSLGLFLWGFGENIWSYYNFFRSEPAPYPSLADIGFAPSIFFWIIGMAYLAKASGAIQVFKKSSWAKLFVLIAPILLLAISYYMLVNVARGGVLVPEGESALKVILDIAYPLGDFLALTLALIVTTLTSKYLGGYYKVPITSMFIGLALMYFGDFSFSYTTTIGTFYNGNWGDLLLATGTFMMTFGIIGFFSRPGTSQKKPILNRAR